MGNDMDARPSASRPTATTTTSTRSTVLPVKEQTERLFEHLHASCLALESLHAAGATSTLRDNPLYVERVATLLGAITPVPLQRLLLLDEARTGGRVGAPDMDASKAGERAGTKDSGLTDSLSATKRTMQLVRVDEEVVGRSTESPWYLTTLAVSEQLYDALIVWKAQGSLEVTNISLAFFRQFSSTVAVGTYASSTSTFTTLTTAIKNWADDFVGAVAKYTPSNGGLAEQYDRNTGAPLSATDLTWSYAAALNTFASRKGLSPPSWGASGLTVPSSCSTGGPGQGGGGGTVAVTFNVVATTVWGENIFLTGGVDALKKWSPNNALGLSSASYPTWSITVNVPASTVIEYKFIRKNNGAVTWESGPNRKFTGPASGSLTLNDTWK